ncbi:MAG: cytoplasmic protein [Desulfovibrionaceae bacterium]
MQKTVFFAFRGDPLCFVHVLLNALDMDGRGLAARIVMEGEAVQLVGALESEDNAFHGLWAQARGKGLVAGACRACSAKLGATAAVEAAGLPFLDDMKGHPSMQGGREQGYEVLIF